MTNPKLETNKTDAKRVLRSIGTYTAWRRWYYWMDFMVFALFWTGINCCRKHFVFRASQGWFLGTQPKCLFQRETAEAHQPPIDGFFGKLSTGKWAKIAKCSTDTALNDIRDLVGKGILKKAEEGGRSTNYVMVEWVWKVLWMKLQIFIALSSKNAASKVVKRMKSIGHEMETIKQVTGLTEKEIETI